MENFKIDENYINSLIKMEKTKEELHRYLDKSESYKGLSHEEVAGLLSSKDEEIWARIFAISKKIKSHIYGDRVVMFAPLYVSDYCVNNCVYCGFNCKAKFERKKLTQEEIKQEIKILEEMGHKRLALECGEDPKNTPIEYVLECLKTIYSMKTKNGEIRRVNVNIAATTVDEYKMLKDAGIGTYILFQETYNKSAYESVHLGGPKSNYEFHTTAFDRAMEAGIEDVGGGVLFGFHDYKFEVLGLMMHTEHLEKKFGVGFHTISVPRICDTEGVDKTTYKNAIDDETFKKIVAILRLAVPYTGIIISTRETQEMRKQLIDLGISQLSAGSSVEVGGYALRKSKGTQFTVADEREPVEVIKWLMEEDLVPSFCTACYRKGRTGDRFMQLAKTGNIKNVCLPNGLLTLKEYSLDYGDEDFKTKADILITSKLDDVKNPDVKQLTKEYLKKLEKGERDFFL